MSIISAVEGVQSASGRSTQGLEEATALFGGVDGFDSLNGLEVLVMVGAAFGADLPEEMLLPTESGASVTVGDLAGRILKRMEHDDDDT